MTAAVRAYDYEGDSVAQRLQRQSLRVVRPRKSRKDPLSSGFPKFVRNVLLIGLFVGLILFARLSLQSLTIGVMMENDDVNAKIEEVRTDSVNLEVQKSTAGNPLTLKKAAKKLGMIIPYSTETLQMDQDVVAYDEEGNLSLSDSLAVASGK